MVTMKEAYRTARISEMQAIDRYGQSRLTLLNAIAKARGTSKDDADELIEAYERLWQPDSIRAQGAWTGNDQARREYDALMRSGVEPSLLQDFSEALGAYRTRTAQARGFAELIRSQDGAEARMALDIEADELTAATREIRIAAQTINPDIGVDIVGADRDGQAGFDPVRRILAVSVAPGEVFDPRDAAYQGLWKSIEDRLDPKERKLLLAEMWNRHGAGLAVSQTADGWQLRRGAIVLERMPAARASETEQARLALFEAHVAREGLVAQAFAQAMLPNARRDRSHALTPIFEKAERFLDRVRNFAAGRGWLTPEDLFDKARDGKLAAREIEGQGGLRVADPRRDPASHRAFKDAMRGLSDTDLRRQIRDQDLAIARQRRRSFGLGAIGAALTRTIETRRSALDDLQRGRALLLAEQRDRAQARLNGNAPPQTGDRAVPPSPGPVETAHPAPGSPNVVPFTARPAPAASASIAQPSAGQPTAGLGTWDVRPSQDPRLPFELTLTHQGVERVMAQAATSEDAGAYSRAFDAARMARGSALPAGAAAHGLAEAANRAGMDHNADIAAIRSAGLIDPALDAVLTQHAVKALVYPLKDGSLVYMTPGGRWEAGTFDQFVQSAELTRAMTGRTAMRDAAELIARQRDASAAHLDRDRGAPGTPAQPSASQPPSPPGPSSTPPASQRPSAPPEPAPARAAAYSAGQAGAADPREVGKPFKLVADHPIDTARRAALAGWTAEQLRDTAIATRSALAAASRSNGSPVERAMLTEGRKALDAALKDRGIHPGSVFATTSDASLDPVRDAKSARSRGRSSGGDAR